MDKPRERITVVATSYPSNPDDPSGHFVRAEARHAARAGHEVTVVAPAPWAERGIGARAAGGSSLFTWPGAVARLKEAPQRIAALPGFLRRARDLVAASVPDRVIAHWLVPSFAPVAMGLSRSTEIVCHGADVRLLLAAPVAVRERVVARVLSQGAEVRFVASSLRASMLSSLTPSLATGLERASRVVPPRVDVDDVPLRESDRSYAVVASRLVPSKRVDVAVRAARSAGLDLVVIGDGPDEERLRRLGRGTAAFQGRLGRRETLGWIASAHVMLHPSAVDAAPTSVLEARALGVPVVSFGAGDVGAWARSDDAIRVVRSEREMAECLQAVAQG